MTLSAAELIGVWVGVGLTLLMFSFLYKDNPFFRFGEHLYLGVSVGYLVTISIFQYLKQSLWIPTFVPLLGKWQDHGASGWQARYLDWALKDYTPKQIGAAPDYWLFIGVALGILIYFRLSKKLSWVSRYTFAFMVGWGSGVAIPAIIEASLLKQLGATVEPFLTWGTASAADRVKMIVILVGVICSLMYFLFSVEHKGPLKVVSKIGICFLMVSFGASFGYTVMGRMALLVGRLRDLIDGSRSSSWFATYVWLAIAVGGLIAWERLRKKTPSEGVQQ